MTKASPLPGHARDLATLVSFVLALGVVSGRASGADRVPLGQSFSRAELATIAVVVAADAAALGFGGALPSPSASMGAPQQDSLDARVSRALYRADGSGRRFLWGIPDVAGAVIVPSLPVLAYAPFAIARAMGAPPTLLGDINADHRLLAYTEAWAWTYFVTTIVKHSLGRPRPYTAEANDHPELAMAAREDNLSFFSGHASGAFVAGSFLAADLSRRLRAGPLQRASPARRFWLGTVLPNVAGYGLPTLVAYSRIVDQKHWPSDVIAGALLGTFVARTVYDAHFGDDGQPRRRDGIAGSALRPSVWTTPAGDRGFALVWAGVL